MKKNVFVLFAALFHVAVVNAVSFNVSLVEVDHIIPNNNGPRNEVPHVDVTDEGITLTSDTLLTDVMVIVKDQCGNIIYASSETVDSMGTTIRVPSLAVSEKSTIDLYYDDRHLYGDIVQ